MENLDFYTYSNGNYTRNPDRIIPILELLAEYWMMYPDTRLGQLLFILAHDKVNLFNLEDEELYNILESLLDEL